MDKGVKIYHVETQEDYDDLMIKLEEQGYMWATDHEPTKKPHYWSQTGKETVIYLNELGEDKISRGSLKNYRIKPHAKEVIKHKAKGVEQMEKVVVPQCVADWYKECEAESLYSTLSYFLNGIKSTEELEKWAETCEGESAYPKVNAEKKIAKMHLYGYEVEKEKKYYWRKKRECFLDFEYSYSPVFINLDTEDRDVFFDSKSEYNCFKTKFTESEIRELVSEEDFNKLERVEITE